MTSYLRFFKNKNKGCTKAIETGLQLKQNIDDRTMRILLLGAGDAGKTTVVKQMKKIHKTLDDNDLSLMKPYIKSAVVSYMKILCTQSELLANTDLDLELESENENENENDSKNHHQINQTKIGSQVNRSIARRIRCLPSPYELDSNIAQDISILWQDAAIRRTLELRHLFQIHDNVAYFFDRVNEIAAADYFPTFEDYVRIRTRSTGFAQEKFNAKLQGFGDYTFEITDVGGQRSERKKWMRVVSDSIHAVLYVVALSEYDLKCFEDNETNRMHESINLFKQCVRDHYLDGKSVVLFFNKYDLFKKKIKRVPITFAFDDYPRKKDPHDETQVCKFIAGKFLKAFENAEKSGKGKGQGKGQGQGNKITIANALHIHRTRALDTDNIERVFRDITIDLVKTRLSIFSGF